MNQLFAQDLSHIVTALQSYIIQQEERLIESNAGDKGWKELEPFKATLRNITYLESIYGTRGV